jgi:prophage tail gpP-like protein
VRATVDHTKGEFKGYTLSQIANSVLAPYKTKFSIKGDTSGMDKPFEKVNVLFGETVFAFIERLCRMRNVYLLTDISGDLVGYRLDNATKTVADLQEGRNILAASAVFDYTGAFSEIQSQGQRPGNDQHFGDAARDTSATVKNSSVQEQVPLVFAAEMPGDQADMRMRAQHENGYNLADQLTVQITVQGWFRDENSLWLEHIGDPVSVYSPLLFTNDRINLAIQSVNSTQGPAGTFSQLTLVLPGAYNGGDQIQTGGTPPGLYSGAV